MELNSVKKMDWKELRKQKNHLLEVINDKRLGEKHRESLDGILHLIDAIQDEAVDVHGVEHDEVFASFCDCGEEKKAFMHNCPNSSNMPEMNGCPKCDDHCPECE